MITPASFFLRFAIPETGEEIWFNETHEIFKLFKTPQPIACYRPCEP